jgi:DNA-binding transcriptional LysR family regulator
MSKGGCEPLISSAFLSVGSRPNIRFEVRDMGAILAMVGEGLGVTIVPELALPHHPEGLAGLRTVPLDPPVRRRLALASRSLESASPAATAFVQLAQQPPREHIETMLGQQ